MAYNISDERLLELCISDPSYCLFYHRSHVKELLPAMAKAYLLIGALEKELTDRLEKDISGT